MLYYCRNIAVFLISEPNRSFIPVMYYESEIPNRIEEAYSYQHGQSFSDSGNSFIVSSIAFAT